ncbi:GNAT family N-acetyltransferase [Marinobacter sp. C2H3]|uniref:GNAT family N-acetyltransferase n=1 Tax=Marinobacter sp. C2H3 TaxID=3119003 RepID=UPI00300F4F22
MTASIARARQLSTQITRDPRRIEQAQRLRYNVFSAEYGSDLGATTPGVDADAFDALCDHLMVMDQSTGLPVATTRVLHQDRVAGLSEFYSAGEFDLSEMARVPGRFAELGRTCVHPDYRNGATLSLLWAELAAYLVAQKVDYVIGCASISMADGGHKAWRIARHLQDTHLAEPPFRATPRKALPHLSGVPAPEKAPALPPLIRTYMRLGARVCGEPCWDPDFRCADVLVLLAVDQLAGRYSRHFLQRAG